MNWSEPEYPQKLLQIYDPPVLFYQAAHPLMSAWGVISRRVD
jgi:predicted Rossmann fold nucleotide-binding protein DprA/Smf involved in DNA uptake